MSERIAIFGGTFNPPHLGHERAIRALIETVKPDRVLVIPDGIPPHKELLGNATAQDRLAMTRLAFSNFPEVEISDLEMRREGKSYTSDTLVSLAKEECELFLLVGGDMLLTLDRWHEFRTIFSLATICAIAREEEKESYARLCTAADRYRSEYGARVIMIDSEPFPVSSTELRLRIGARAENLKALMDERVLAYIEERGLYV